jgi:hypothetical protein
MTRDNSRNHTHWILASNCNETAVSVSAAWLILLTHPLLSDKYSPDFVDYTTGRSQDMSVENERHE